ncbi:MAG: MBOAT family protein [Oscillospiraceae bacterium]|nr:MBOAT family protein [Oscillospiraceae bacterium]
MLFSSIPFLYYFLPAVLLCYFAAPKKLKNGVLFAFSLIFYAWGEPVYVFLMAASITFAWGFALLMEKAKTQKARKIFMIISVVISFSFLAYFKYADFFISNFNAATGLSVPLLKIALPVGISFYTFQIASYTIDVYRGDTEANKNILDFGTYVVLFPQLIAGPIVRYVDIAEMLKSRTHTFEKVAYGVQRFCLGLGKKVLFANAFGELCSIFRESSEQTVLFYWIYAAAFMLQIYFDFSGYSDMAIGLGSIFGFKFLENFDFPYVSKSITEFWRRWHMSLGSWFRDYVYIPLGGNRVSKPRFLFNIFVVWFLTGFWHGADWQFIVWGLFYGTLLVIEKMWLKKYLDKAPAFLCHVYVLFFTAIGFVIFNSVNIGGAFADLGAMFGFAGLPLFGEETLYYLRSYALMFIAGALLATPVIKNLLKKVNATKTGGKIIAFAKPLGFAAVIIMVTGYLADGSFNPFLYFRF